MPPRAASKRLRSSTRDKEEDEPPKKKAKKIATVPPRKPTLFDDLDASLVHSSPKSARDVLKELHGDDEDDESSLSSLSDADLSDPRTARSGVVLAVRNTEGTEDEDDEDAEDVEDDEEEDLEFEEVHHIPEPQPNTMPADMQDLDLTLVRDSRVALTNLSGGRKGPTKKERAVRTACHRVHVQCLLWHNAVRNSWLCDQEVQATLLSHIPPKLWDDIDHWRSTCESGGHAEPANKKNSKHKKGKGKQPANRKPKDRETAAMRLEESKMNMAHGDPIFRLMRALTMFWKQRFRITAPGIRKLGYMSLERLDRITKAYTADPSDPGLFGERIESLEDFRKCVQECAGSRDIGAQLFTALLRAIGLEARMVASLQPLGFGWTKIEEAEPEKTDGANNTPEKPRPTRSKTPPVTPLRRPKRGGKHVVNIESDGYITDEFEDNDDAVIELPPLYSEKKNPVPKSSYDKSLQFPHYWTEVWSPAAKKYLPVDPLVKFVVATNRELVESLEPRGAKADKAKQVIAYVVGHSSDGSAKDVTLRYLKRQVMPGRTKGMRMPIEKIPVYNRHGKIKRHEQFDWFQYVMRGYERGASNSKFPITETDMLEDSTDLKPRQPEKKVPKAGLETLQYYKTSTEFVLERHLKREEALLAAAEPVKVFTSKGKGGKKNEEEHVYLRKDVVAVKSAETWHKQGRVPTKGEEPLKRVPYRAATINRKLAIEEAERATGQKVLQGLYSFEQTDWIIPPPIKDGKIPKNEYGNIDLFVEHMLPSGAVHVPYRRAMPVCKRLGIDFAEAVVDFDFGHRMAVPVLQGVVVAEEYHDKVMQELVKDEAERTRKADEKRLKVALDMWRKLYRGMSIAQRLRREYGDVDEPEEVFSHHRESAEREPDKQPETKPEALAVCDDDHDSTMAGGFLSEGFDLSEEEPDLVPVPTSKRQRSNYFPVGTGITQDSDSDIGLVIEDNITSTTSRPRATIPDSADNTDNTDVENQSLAEASLSPPRKGSVGRHVRDASRRGRYRQPVVEDSQESNVDEDSIESEDESDEYVE